MSTSDSRARALSATEEACARHRHPRGSRRGEFLRRASKLDNIVTIARLVETLDEYGIPREAWTPIRTENAAIIQASAEDFLSSAGVAVESIVIFRTCSIEGGTPGDASP
ncbi:phage head completion protein [Microvirga aerophila]|uniref:phage head completion protein n=1 Tax=Microvirga aerophila TaxID=670291 RepID=UPI00403A7948